MGMRWTIPGRLLSLALPLCLRLSMGPSPGAHRQTSYPALLLEDARLRAEYRCEQGRML